MKIFVVCGTTGEYSERTEWMVAAYTNEDDAKQHVIKAEEYAVIWDNFRRTEEGGALNLCELIERKKTLNPMDPKFTWDCMGADYWYAEVELREVFTSPETVQ